MRLCLATGWTEEEIESWPLAKLNRWRVFDSIEPIGGRRIDHSAALNAWASIASAGGSVGYGDMLTDWWREPKDEAMESEEIEAKAASFGALMERIRGKKNADSS